MKINSFIKDVITLFNFKLLRDRVFGCDKTPDGRYYFTERLFFPLYCKLDDFFIYVNGLSDKKVDSSRTEIDNIIIRHNKAIKRLAYWRLGIFEFARVKCDCCNFIRVSALCLLIVLLMTLLLSSM
jgi:hypothetical protein